MKIAVVGLGLIGGSLAHTLRVRTPHTLYGADTDPAVLADALAKGVLDAPLTEALLAQCDLVALALFPDAAVAWLAAHAPQLAQKTVVFDCAGTKSAVCGAGFALAQRYGFTFFGGHPMAGTEHSGWAAARDGLFDRAYMILVPPPGGAPQAQQRLEELFLGLGFGGITLTTAAEHDRIIAYTSQLAHVVSSAYIQSPTAQRFAGFSAGSFKDMTRVAYLNPDMWTQLFLANRGPLCSELDGLIACLEKYRAALRDGDAPALHALLQRGRELKIQSDRQTEKKKKGDDL